ncbi:diphosphomevalonate/mevalonate 3,5-bisphosphate decarboxylase family protein [Blattabacterium cuenoti]|uniref:diphosphomevalonate/mevalonate 3,5-bisphosphate decarboxylase family protein n=1 Tax=Blattabacterium cuenoti TaxID=1653831 RepID=UPI001EEB28B1|nr:diphosphomevalonate decarboxylase [Blattabacterium cuenoti]
MNKKDFIYSNYNKTVPFIKNGVIKKISYSNIALIKYWGKSKNNIQIPSNSSISYRLNNVYTVTKIIYKMNDRKNSKFYFKFLFSGKEHTFFYLRMKKFFHRIFVYCSYLRNFNFIIETNNTFPHSSGIASSASSISSIALCIMDIEKKLINSLTKSFILKKASFLARLGSGSACRSIYTGLSVWGAHKLIKGSNNFYSIPYPYTVHPIFRKIEDTILIIDDKPKKILSSKGHQLMNNHPYAKERFKHANNNMVQLISILKSGNIKKFGILIEQEALNLHAMIMTSNPYYLCFQPNTIEVIQNIWKYRIKSKKNIYFTLDAGANIHILYPIQEKKTIFKWIKNNLYHFYKNIIESFCIWN